jgi:hypothetical protein
VVGHLLGVSGVFQAQVPEVSRDTSQILDLTLDGSTRAIPPRNGSQSGRCSDRLMCPTWPGSRVPFPAIVDANGRRESVPFLQQVARAA